MVPLIESATSAAVIGCWRPEESTTPKRYSFQMPVNCQITVTIMIGGDSGRMILQKMRQKPAPSMRAALIRSSGIDSSSCGRRAS